eukprot:TRINITY_DN12418_c0_g1_i1.p1 TRINITY_DN12418_c0_g1~~TRINITY_DN12418_c0_g1_i1.p1  ORF type:complete len:391 (-),score=97.65 TRINITY_DN12418_c0_g1_i1:113-1285(-)
MFLGHVRRGFSLETRAIRSLVALQRQQVRLPVLHQLLSARTITTEDSHPPETKSPGPIAHPFWKRKPTSKGPKRKPKGYNALPMTEDRLAKIRERKERNKAREERVKHLSFEEWYTQLKDLIKRHKRHRISSLELLLEKVETPKHMRGALYIFRKFQEFGVTVEDRSANLLIEKLCQFNKYTTAHHFITDFKFNRVFPDLKTCHHLLIHFYLKRQIDLAKTLSYTLRRRFGDLNEFLLADIKGHVQSDQYEEAQKYLLEARQKGIKIEPSYYDVFLRAGLKKNIDVVTGLQEKLETFENRTELEENVLKTVKILQALAQEDPDKAIELWNNEKPSVDVAEDLIQLGRRVNKSQFNNSLRDLFKNLSDHDFQLPDNLRTLLATVDRPQKSA